MKNIKVIILGLGLSSPFIAGAQSDIDALRYSQSSITGTARYVGLGGAFGALGADFTSLSYNPAGIGLYRHSEFTFTPSLNAEQTSSTFLNQTGMDNKYNFNLGNIGMVWNKPLSYDNASEGWKSVSFGVGYNRLNDFNSRTFYQGINKSNSLVDNILNGDGVNPGVNSGEGTSIQNLESFIQYPAFQTYLIDTIPGNPTHYYGAIPPGGGEMQRTTSETSGSSGEMVISLGANYSNKLYLGATVGIDFISYTQNTNYEEFDPGNVFTDFNSFTLSQYLNTTGTGINLKLGMIYAAQDWLRFGIAIHTPTWYSLHDDYSNTITTTFHNGDAFSFDSPAGSYDYNLATPFKAIGSVSFIIGKMGLVSADYEFVDYSTMRLGADDPSAFTDVNNAISQNYTATGNIKLGTEWRLADIFRVRAGYDYFGSPYAGGYPVSGGDMSRTAYTAGFGIRDKAFSIDLGYAYSVQKGYYQQYYLSDQAVPGAVNKYVTNDFLMTFGWRF